MTNTPVIYTVEIVCAWPGCDEYRNVSWDTPRRLSARARKYALAAGWSWTQRAGERATTRCPEHRGRRKPR